MTSAVPAFDLHPQPDVLQRVGQMHMAVGDALGTFDKLVLEFSAARVGQPDTNKASIAEPAIGDLGIDIHISARPYRG